MRNHFNLATFVLLVFSSFAFSQNKISLDFNGIKNISKSTYEKAVLTKPLKIKSPSFPDSVIARIDRLLREYGYFFPEIKIEKTEFNKDSTSARLSVKVNENNQSIVKQLFVSAQTPDDSAFVYEKLSWVVGSALVPVGLRKIFSEILSEYENKGFPFAKIRIKSIKWNAKKNAELFIEFLNGKASIIDTIIIKGNTKTKDYVIIRNARIKKGEKYSRKKIFEAVSNLARLGFFKKIAKPKFYFDSADKGVLEFSVEEKNTNLFDGLLGYAPKQKDKPGYLTGYVKVDLRNILGTERSFGFEWRKIDRHSQFFDINYTEPWIFGLPFNIKLTVNQRTQDTTYAQRKYSTSFEYLATARLKASLIYSYEETIPFENSSLSIKHSVFNTSGVNFYYDKRDNILMPSSGYSINSAFKYSRKNLMGNYEEEEKASANQYRIEIDLAGFIRIFKTHVVALGLHLKTVEGENIEISDLYRFGGTNSLRGFNEEIFYGNIITWSNLEYRLMLSREAYIFGFFDSGYYDNKINSSLSDTAQKDFTFGYGAGVSFATGVGVMKISFALGENDSFSQGKIHFGISNGF